MKKITLFLLLFCFSIVGQAQDLDSPEKITLNNAVMQETGTTELVVKEIRLDWANNNIKVRLGEAGATGRNMEWVEYTGTTARNLMTSLNTANLSTKSLNQRIMERLQTDGHLGTGAISTE